MIKISISETIDILLFERTPRIMNRKISKLNFKPYAYRAAYTYYPKNIGPACIPLLDLKTVALSVFRFSLFSTVMYIHLFMFIDFYIMYVTKSVKFFG